jgi:hypothetical protein
MQTIRLEVKDGYTQNILDMLGSVKDIMLEKIEVQKDPNLEYDPYFYERREELHKLRDDIRSGKMEMYDFNDSMDELIEELQK